MWLCGMILQVKHVACSNPQKDWKLETWKWWRKISSTYTDVYHPGNAVLSFWGLLQLYHLLSLIFHSIPMWKCYRYFIPFYFHSIPIISVVIFHSIPIFHFRTKPLISALQSPVIGTSPCFGRAASTRDRSGSCFSAIGTSRKLDMNWKVGDDYY